MSLEEFLLLHVNKRVIGWSAIWKVLLLPSCFAVLKFLRFHL